MCAWLYVYNFITCIDGKGQKIYLKHLLYVI